MSEKIDIPTLARSTFFTGQRLTAKDLTELQRANRELRWLHNRSLHGWGIGIGFAVNGERGDTSCTIEPGFGVDCKGQEIIQSESITTPVPAVAGSSDGGEAVYYLVVSYQSDANQTITERRPGVCLPEGTVRLSEKPLVAWRTPDKLVEGLELILAQAWIQHCQLSRPLSLAPRRYARPSQQPYIAVGQTEKEKTDWKLWLVDGQPVGLFVDVDTLNARFQTAPRYTAHLVGERFLADPSAGPLLVAGLSAVVGGTPEGFTLQVHLPNITTGPLSVNPSSLLDASEGPKIFNQLGLHVVWMGVEG